EALKAQAVLVRTQISRALQRSTQAEETENQKSDRTGNVSDVILEIDYLSQKEMQDQWPADEYKKRYEKYRNAIEATEN
ncbi:SpoIID/LytB domain-containing protein, partial [Veillonella parvula]